MLTKTVSVPVHYPPISKVRQREIPIENNRMIARFGDSIPILLYDGKKELAKTLHTPSSDLDLWGHDLEASFRAQCGTPLDNRKIQLTMPTTNSFDYLKDSICKLCAMLRKEIDILLPESAITILVVLNGSFPDNEKEPLLRLIRDINAKNTGITLELVHTRMTGLAHAMNIGYQIALEQNRGCILFIDDDALPSPGSVSSLVRSLQGSSHPALVGGKPNPHIPEPARSPVERKFSWLLQQRARNVLVWPIGAFYGMRTALYPLLPNNLIANDMFLVYYFLYHSANVYFPKGARINYNVSGSFLSWAGRNKRIDSSHQHIHAVIPESISPLVMSVRNAVNRRIAGDYRLATITDTLRDLACLGEELLRNYQPQRQSAWGLDPSTKPGGRTGPIRYRKIF